MNKPRDIPELYVNRELGQLAFNRRVLAQAENRATPLLERLRFLCIVSSNLDEFFEIRVAGLKAEIEAGSLAIGPDRMPAAQVFGAGLLPFIPGDLVKSALASLAFPAAWRLANRRGGIDA